MPVIHSHVISWTLGSKTLPKVVKDQLYWQKIAERIYLASTFPEFGQSNTISTYLTWELGILSLDFKVNYTHVYINHLIMIN